MFAQLTSWTVNKKRFEAVCADLFENLGPDRAMLNR